MRVWVLASCGGLLALSACSADQTGSSPIDSSPLLEDELTQWDDQPQVSRPSVQPTLQPETRAVQPLPTPNGGARRQSSTLSPSQLRARVERLRAQQTQPPTRAASLPAIAKLSTGDIGSHPPPPQASLSLGPEGSPKPGVVSPLPVVVRPVASLNRPSPAVLSAPGASISAGTSAPDRPTPLASAANLPPANLSPANLSPAEVNADVTGATYLPSAADLGPTEPATLASHFPIRPSGHQSYSHRRDQAPIRLSRAPIEQAMQREDTALHGAAVHQTARLPETIPASQPLFPRSAPAAPTAPAASAAPALEEATSDLSAIPATSFGASPGEILFPRATPAPATIPTVVGPSPVATAPPPIESKLGESPPPGSASQGEANPDTAQRSETPPGPDRVVTPAAIDGSSTDVTADTTVDTTVDTTLPTASPPTVHSSHPGHISNVSGLEHSIAVTPLPTHRPLSPVVSTHRPQFSQPRLDNPLPTQGTHFQPTPLPQADGDSPALRAGAGQANHGDRSEGLALAVADITSPALVPEGTDSGLGATGTELCPDRATLDPDSTPDMAAALAAEPGAERLAEADLPQASPEPDRPDCW